jgi:hypothetical protein
MTLVGLANNTEVATPTEHAPVKHQSTLTQERDRGSDLENF